MIHMKHGCFMWLRYYFVMYFLKYKKKGTPILFVCQYFATCNGVSLELIHDLIMFL